MMIRRKQHEHVTLTCIKFWEAHKVSSERIKSSIIERRLLHLIIDQDILLLCLPYRLSKIELNTFTKEIISSLKDDYKVICNKAALEGSKCMRIIDRLYKWKFFLYLPYNLLYRLKYKDNRL